MTTDHRQVFRFHVDVMATEEQVPAIQGLLGEALCGAPDDHDPPCRLAWSIGWYRPDEEGSFSSAEAEEIRGFLEPIEVWPQRHVDHSLDVGRSES